MEKRNKCIKNEGNGKTTVAYTGIVMASEKKKSSVDEESSGWKYHEEQDTYFVP